jgi:hypothetical protein
MKGRYDHSKADVIKAEQEERKGPLIPRGQKISTCLILVHQGKEGWNTHGGFGDRRFLCFVGDEDVMRRAVVMMTMVVVVMLGMRCGVDLCQIKVTYSPTRATQYTGGFPCIHSSRSISNRLTTSWV